MLNRRENIIMKYIFNKCVGKNTCLISCNEMLKEIYPVEMSINELEEIMDNLVLEKYISLIRSEKNNKEMFCISLKENGEAFQREIDNRKKTIMKYVVRTVLLACLSFVVGIILKKIFS